MYLVLFGEDKPLSDCADPDRDCYSNEDLCWMIFDSFKDIEDYLKEDGLPYYEEYRINQVYELDYKGSIELEQIVSINFKK